MPNDPMISVVMSVYNGGKFLTESIESILKQNYKDFEFIIIDDCSIDDSYEIILSFNDERITVIKNDTNIGLTKSLNKGIERANGKYIARQDADDISLPNRFEKQISYFEKNSDVVLLGSSIFRIDYNGRIINNVKSLEKPVLTNFLESNHLKHGSAMFRKDIFELLGGYNEIFRYSQDYDLWLRFADKYKVHNISEPLYKLRIHNKSIGYRKIEETRLYCQLARKLIKKEINDFQLDIIKEKGIKQLYAYLDNKEILNIEKRVHEIRSGILIEEGDIKAAREEYKKIFRLEPFNLINNINLIRSIFGKSFMYKSSKFFDITNNLIKKI